MTKKILWLSFCLLLAGFLGVAWQLVNPDQQQVISKASASKENAVAVEVFTESRQTISALVAMHDADAGMRFKDIEWQWKKIPEQQVDSIIEPLLKGSANLSQWQNSVLRKSIAKGMPVSSLQLVQPDQPGFLAAAVRQGHRGVSIPVSRVAAGAGLVSPGDYVDVVLTSYLNKGQGEEFADVASLRTRTIVEQVRVLAINDSAAAQPAADKENRKRFFNDSSATIEASPDQAQKLLLASRMGDLALNLRAPGDHAVSENTSESIQLGDLFSDSRVIGPQIGLVQMRGSEKSIAGEDDAEKKKRDE